MFSYLLHYPQTRPLIPPKGLRGPVRGPSPTNYAFSFWRLQHANRGVKLSPPSKSGLLGVSKDSQTFSLSSKTCAFSDNRCSTSEVAAAFQSGLAIVVQCAPSQSFMGVTPQPPTRPVGSPGSILWLSKTKVVFGRVLARYARFGAIFPRSIIGIVGRSFSTFGSPHVARVLEGCWNLVCAVSREWGGAQAGLVMLMMLALGGLLGPPKLNA